ncbi:MAG: phosphoenolpyruvate-utilizing N-terminal domain-containing protein, partial [Candidatus Kapaibacteriota bacterium]
MKKNKKKSKSNEIQLKGIPVSKGYASGTAFVIKKYYHNFDSDGSASKPEEEFARFKQAISQYEHEFERQIQNIKKENPLAGEVLQSLKLILSDPEIEKSVLSFINQGYTAEFAVEQTYKNYEKNLLSVRSKIIRERAFELEQIKNRFLEILINNKLS